MNDISDALADYRALIDSAEGAHLATLGDAAGPEASYARCRAIPRICGVIPVSA